MIPNRGLGRCSLRFSLRARAAILQRHHNSGAKYNGRGGEYNAHHLHHLRHLVGDTRQDRPCSAGAGPVYAIRESTGR